jgi:hypothetical protein
MHIEELQAVSINLLLPHLPNVADELFFFPVETNHELPSHFHLLLQLTCNVGQICAKTTLQRRMKVHTGLAGLKTAPKGVFGLAIFADAVRSDVSTIGTLPMGRSDVELFTKLGQLDVGVVDIR